MTVTQDHTYYVDSANSPEEAEVIAERMLEDGDSGALGMPEVEYCEAIPATVDDSLEAE